MRNLGFLKSTKTKFFLFCAYLTTPSHNTIFDIRTLIFNVLSTCVSVHHVYAWYQWGPEEDIGFLGLELETVVSHCMGAGN